MTQAAADISSPPARALQGWWRELASLQPRRLWFGSFLFHHVEVLVEIERTVTLDPIDRLLLRSFAGSTTLPPVDRQVLTRLLNATAQDGLLESGPNGWLVTEVGRAAAETGTFAQRVIERRPFVFLDNAVNGSTGVFFTPRRPLAATVPPEGWRVDTALIAECVSRPDDWKRQHAFPSDVRRLVEWSATPSDWRAIPIARTERFVGLVVETEEGITAYVVRPESWGLERDAPAFILGRDWRETFPDLATEVSLDAWRDAWQAWCRTHGAPAEEASIEREGTRLIVRVPATVLERLRSARGDPLRNDAWLLAGTGRCREIVALDVAERG